MRAPRVNDKRIDSVSGERKRFASAILPAWARKSPKVAEMLPQDKVCLLVIIGVRANGTKELVALDDGHREFTESWADLLRSCKRRGMRGPGARGRRWRTGVLGSGA